MEEPRFTQADVDQLAAAYEREMEYTTANTLRLEDELEALKEAATSALDALIWCSGSPDFGEGGQAHEGWVKLGRPTIEVLLAILPRVDEDT